MLPKLGASIVKNYLLPVTIRTDAQRVPAFVHSGRIDMNITRTYSRAIEVKVMQFCKVELDSSGVQCGF